MTCCLELYYFRQRRAKQGLKVSSTQVRVNPAIDSRSTVVDNTSPFRRGHQNHTPVSNKPLIRTRVRFVSDRTTVVGGVPHRTENLRNDCLNQTLTVDKGGYSKRHRHHVGLLLLLLHPANGGARCGAVRFCLCEVLFFARRIHHSELYFFSFDPFTESPLVSRDTRDHTNHKPHAKIRSNVRVFPVLSVFILHCSHPPTPLPLAPQPLSWLLT